MNGLSRKERPRWADGLRDFASHYDLFLVDQYGVLHDGEALYPGAGEAVTALADAGKAVALLTNSGRSEAYNRVRVARLGVPIDKVARVVTSGDVAREWLRESYAGASCLALTSGDNHEDVETAGLRRVEKAADADLLLVSGLPLPGAEVTADTYAELLDDAAAHGLPMVCCNPDDRGLSGSKVVVAAGAVAAWYAARGGKVRFFGKPYPEVFDHAMRECPGVAPGRVVMLGDMPHTDMVGAMRAGIDSVLVLGGVHAMDTNASTTDARLALAHDLLEQSSTSASYVMPGFRW